MLGKLVEDLPKPKEDKEIDGQKAKFYKIKACSRCNKAIDATEVFYVTNEDGELKFWKAKCVKEIEEEIQKKKEEDEKKEAEEKKAAEEKKEAEIKET